MNNLNGTPPRAALVFCAVLSILVSSRGAAQQASPITADDYGQWQSLGTGTLSADGNYFAVGVSRVDGTAVLQVYGLSDTAGEPGSPIATIDNGGAPQFSGDGRWLAYRIEPSDAEQERLRAADEPVRNRAGLRDLASGEEEIFDDVRSFEFDDSGSYLLLRGYAPEDSDAADLIVRNLSSGASVNFGNIAEYAWQDDAPRLAMTVSTENGAGNGIQLYDAAAGTLTVLDSGDAEFIAPTWREEASDLAVLRSFDDDAYNEPGHRLLAWRNLAASPGEPLRFAGDALAPGPDGAAMRLVEHRSPTWSDDGSAIFFGIREWQPAPAEGADDDAEEAGTDSTGGASGPPGDAEDVGSADKSDEPEPADVDVWHARDERIIPMQRLQEQRDRERSYLAVWHLDDDRFVQLGSDVHESVELLAGQKHATETDRKPYMVDGMFGRRWFDVDLIDVATGERTRVVDRVRYFSGGSATGEHLLYFKDDQHFAYDIATGAHTDLTSSLAASFVDDDYDYPVEQKPSWGIAGWAEGDEAVLLYDRYDVWRVAPDGSDAQQLTRGADDEIRYRYVDLDRGPFSFGAAPEAIALDEPLMLSIYGEWTKMSGYSRLATAAEGSEPQRLLWLDKNVGRLAKAEDADTFAYVVQDFDDSPDYFVGGPDLADAPQITATNPFQADYAWGHSQLVDYSCEFGPRVQGALFYPAGYEEGRTYPMITYVYERLSQTVHSYSVPSERSSYNPAVWTSQGYFVLQPDIVFRGRMPGTSAVECIRPAVQTVVDTGMVDADRVGLVGHSWGGYEAAFVPTKTDIFAASVSGAALTNFFSMFGTIHWNQGMPESSHWETGQARMDVPYWDDMEAYVRESPVIGIPDLETPMLMAFGDADGTVDWHQGVEMYNYARRAGKQFVMLVYAGENHSNRQEKNQIDYHHRILDWFGHYLKGEPAKPWITDGVSVIDRNDELEQGGRGGRGGRR